jgi:hypothetical protein
LSKKNYLSILGSPKDTPSIMIIENKFYGGNLSILKTSLFLLLCRPEITMRTVFTVMKKLKAIGVIVLWGCRWPSDSSKLPNARWEVILINIRVKAAMELVEWLKY